VCRGALTHTMTVVLRLYYSAYLVFECRCMSNGVFIQFVCQVSNLMAI